MESQDWKPVDEKVAKLIIEKINALHDIALFDAETTRLLEKKLSFYGDYSLLKATEFSAFPPMTMKFLFRGGELVKLDGSPDAINTVNSKAKVNINKNNLLEYAKFFLSSLMTEDGSFRLVESLDEVEFSADPSKDELEKISKAIKKPVIKEEGDGFDLEANMIYSDCIYKANIFITKKGDLDIEKEEILLSDMPVRQIMLR